jgi:hypothetical protein
MTQEIIYAISSSCPDAPILPGYCLALLKGLSRLARWWGLLAPHIVYTTRIGELDDPGAIDVQVVPDWSGAQFGGEDLSGAIAFHTVAPDGRPICYISWAEVQVSGGTLTGPDGLVSAIFHEMAEAFVDPLTPTSKLVINPQGQQEPVEVCDRIQGTDYEESGSPGIWLANALGPAGFRVLLGNTSVDIASDLRLSTLTSGFPLTPGGYYAPVGADPVFGERATEHLRKRVAKFGARSGAINAARSRQAK